jgi:hypothetical protein
MMGMADGSGGGGGDGEAASAEPTAAEVDARLERLLSGQETTPPQLSLAEATERGDEGGRGDVDVGDTAVTAVNASAGERAVEPSAAERDARFERLLSGQERSLPPLFLAQADDSFDEDDDGAGAGAAAAAAEPSAAEMDARFDGLLSGREMSPPPLSLAESAESQDEGDDSDGEMAPSAAELDVVRRCRLTL